MLIFEESQQALLQDNLQKLSPEALWNGFQNITEISVGTLSSLDTHVVMSAFETQLIHSLRLHNVTETSMKIIRERLPRTDITTLTFSQSPIIHLQEFMQSLVNSRVTTLILDSISNEDAFLIMNLIPQSINELILKNLSSGVTKTIASLIKKTAVSTIGIDSLDADAVFALRECFVEGEINHSNTIFALTLKNLPKLSMDIVAEFIFNKSISALNLSMISSDNIIALANKLPNSNLTHLTLDQLEDYSYIFTKLLNSRISVFALREYHAEKITPHLDKLNGSSISTLHLWNTSATVTLSIMQSLSIWTQIINLNVRQISKESAAVICQALNSSNVKTLMIEDISYDATHIFCSYFPKFEKVNSLCLAKIASFAAQAMFQTIPQTKLKLLQLRYMPDNSTAGLANLKLSKVINLCLRELSPQYMSRLAKEFPNLPIKVLTLRKLPKESCDIIAKNLHLFNIDWLSLIYLNFQDCEEVCKVIKESKITKLTLQYLDDAAVHAILSSLPPSLKKLHYSNLTPASQQRINQWQFSSSSSQGVAVHNDDNPPKEPQKIVEPYSQNKAAPIASTTATPTALTLLSVPSGGTTTFNNTQIFFAPAQKPPPVASNTNMSALVQNLANQGITFSPAFLNTYNPTGNQNTQTLLPYSPQSLFVKPNPSTNTTVTINRKQLLAIGTFNALLNDPQYNKRQKNNH